MDRNTACQGMFTFVQTNLKCPDKKLSKLKAKATGELLAKPIISINFNTMSGQLHLRMSMQTLSCPDMCQAMFQKLFYTL